MEGNSEDLIKQFKSKVEEAITLLPQIPEIQRHEVWTYWQIISVAVKAAVGGRGPIVAKHKVTDKRRPRGRPRLNHVQQNEVNLGKSNELNVAEGNAIKVDEIKPKRWDFVNLDRSVQFELSSPAQQTDYTGENGKESCTEILLCQASSFDETNPVKLIKSSSSDIKTGTVVFSDAQTDDADAGISSRLEQGNNSRKQNIEYQYEPVHCLLEEIVHTQELSNDDSMQMSEGNLLLKTSEKVETYSDEKPTNHWKINVSETSPTLVTTTTAQEISEISLSLGINVDNAQTTCTTLHNGTHRNEGLSHVPETVSDEADQTHDITGKEILLVSATVECKNSETVDNAANESSQVVGTSIQEKSIPPKVAGEIASQGNMQLQATKNISGTANSESMNVNSLLIQSADPGSGTVVKSQQQRVNIVVQHNPPVTLKRKRGRPRKCADKLSQTSNTVSSKFQQTGMAPATASGEQELLHGDLKAIITALDLEERSSTFTKKASASHNVRRSARRIKPNRDDTFCYFAPTHQEAEMENHEENAEKKEEEEMECEKEDNNPSTVQAAEKGDGDEKQKDKETTVKTEAEKLQERTCPSCSVVLMSASSMAAHMRIHSGERPFACPVCHKTFTTKGNCERHEVTHVGLKAFTCTQCNKKFTEKKSLKIHMRCHTGERPYLCKICGMRFFQSGTLKTHMDRHTGHKGHLCELCGKAFRQSCQLRVHMRRHTMHMPFSCQHCFKSFYTKSDMERHEFKHKDDRPFSCDQCPKTFTRLQYLLEHQNTHLGNRPCKCVVCGMTFRDIAACRRHVKKHKLMEPDQSAQQIHVEVPSDMPVQQVQVILDEDNLNNYHNAHIQTIIIPEQPTTCGSDSIISSCPSTQPSAHAILSNLGLEVEEPSEIYQVTLVDTAQAVTISTEPNAVDGTSSTTDFSAITLLANATTQVSAPQ